MLHCGTSSRRRQVIGILASATNCEHAAATSLRRSGGPRSEAVIRRLGRCARRSRGRASPSRPDRPHDRQPQAAAAVRPGSPRPAPRRAREGTSDPPSRESPEWVRRSRTGSRPGRSPCGRMSWFCAAAKVTRALDVAARELADRRLVEGTPPSGKHARVADVVLDHRLGVRPVHLGRRHEAPELVGRRWEPALHRASPGMC
jgi:hypothetical protein